MHRFSLYVLLILVFLSLSKWFAPSEKNIPYLINERTLSQIFGKGPVSVLLLENFQAGLLFKTYYLKLKTVKPFGFPEIIIVRTHELFWNKVQEYKGMSIFRKEGQKTVETPVFESHVPLPPEFSTLAIRVMAPGLALKPKIKYGNFIGPTEIFPIFFTGENFAPVLHFTKRRRPIKKINNLFLASTMNLVKMVSSHRVKSPQTQKCSKGKVFS